MKDSHPGEDQKDCINQGTGKLLANADLPNPIYRPPCAAGNPQLLPATNTTLFISTSSSITKHVLYYCCYVSGDSAAKVAWDLLRERKH